MDNNIIDFNAFRKKKAEEEEKKKKSSNNTTFFDDDEEFTANFSLSDSFEAMSDASRDFIANIYDVLADREEYDSSDEYEAALCEELEALADDEPSAKQLKAHKAWEEEVFNLQQLVLFNRLVDVMEERARKDDEEIQEAFKNGSLKEDDLFFPVENFNENPDNILSAFANVTNASKEGRTIEEAIADIRKMTYSMNKHLEIRYEQLKSEEPPVSNAIMHSKWEEELAQNKVQIAFSSITKGLLLLVYDFLSSTDQSTISDAVKSLMDDFMTFSQDNDELPWLVDDDDDDDEYDDDDDFDYPDSLFDNWDWDDDDEDEDDDDSDDDWDDEFMGDYDYLGEDDDDDE